MNRPTLEPVYCKQTEGAVDGESIDGDPSKSGTITEDHTW